MVNFLRKNWERLDSMFALRSELQGAIDRVDSETESSIIKAMGNAGTCATRQAESQAKKIGETSRQQHLAAIVQRHVARLLPTRTVRAALYLPSAEELTQPEKGVPYDSTVYSKSYAPSSSSSLLYLVPQVLRHNKEFLGDYAIDSQKIMSGRLSKTRSQTFLTHQTS